MAKATVTTTHVEKKVTRVEKVPVKTIHLELTEGDADFLMAVLNLIGGHTKNSPRKYAVRIQKALQGATGNTGYYVQSTDAGKLVNGNGLGAGAGRGAIYFNDYPDPDGGRENAAPEPPAKQAKTESAPFDLSKLFTQQHVPFGGYADWPKPDFTYRPNTGQYLGLDGFWR